VGNGGHGTDFAGGVVIDIELRSLIDDAAVLLRNFDDVAL
jgi:hypothetical protein